MNRKRLRSLGITLLIVVLMIIAGKVTGISFFRFWERRSHLGDIFLRMIPPDWGYFPRILQPLIETVQMSVTGTAFGAFLALLCAPFCSAPLGTPRGVRLLLRAAIQILRSFPTLILALVATFVFGLGTFAGTTAITLYTFAIITRLTYEDIESCNLAAWKALRAMGCGFGRSYFRALLPEVVSSYFSNTLYLLETNVRHSAILGYVGAGGIGLLLNEKISWKEYDRVGAVLAALFLAVCVIELLSTWLNSVVRGNRHLGGTAQRAVVVALAALIVWSLVSIRPPDFSRTSPALVRSLFAGLLNPDWSFVFQRGSGGLGMLLLETLCIAFLGTALGAVLSFPLALLGSGRLMPRPVALLFRTVVMAIRSIPFLIYGILFIRVTGPGAFTGVLTMAVCSVGLLTKRFSEAIDTLDLRAWRALGAMGISPVLRLRHAVLPLLLPALFGAALYRFDVNTREASVLGIVGAGGIGAPLIFAMNHYNWRTAGAISFGLILIVGLIDLLSARIRRTR